MASAVEKLSAPDISPNEAAGKPPKAPEKSTENVTEKFNSPWPTIADEKAVKMPSGEEEVLHMKNLRLHASGAFSNVYRGQLLQPDNKPPIEIAIKKTWPGPHWDEESSGLSRVITHHTFELMFLSGAHRPVHKNIASMMYVFGRIDKGKRFCQAFVFEYMPMNLNEVIRNDSEPLDHTDIKIYTWQIFNGLRYLQDLSIAHRDLKPVNILVDPEKAYLKIGDFGSAKLISSTCARSTSYQVSRFYRPPELLLHSNYYNSKVDIWSAGCVVAEMVRRRVLFRGRNTEHQLKLIFHYLGSPSPEELKALRTPYVHTTNNKIDGAGIHTLFDNAKDAEFVNLIKRILVYKPKDRLHGCSMLDDPLFKPLFEKGAKRGNGKLIAPTLSAWDKGNANQKIVPDKMLREMAQGRHRPKALDNITGQMQDHQHSTPNELATAMDCSPPKGTKGDSASKQNDVNSKGKEETRVTVDGNDTTQKNLK